MNQFIKRYEELGWDFKEIRNKHCIRVNNLKINARELVKRLESKGLSLKKVPFTENGYYVRSKFSLGATPEYLLGLYGMQEAVSQLPVKVLEPKGVVLDSCAAPGGKTAQIAEKVEAVVALESQSARLSSLLNNLERFGVNNALVYHADARSFETKFKFKKILVDAPCSGNFVTDREWFDKQSVSNFLTRQKLQKEILSNVAGLLDAKGELVYSTCSLEPEENELVLQWAVEKLGLKVVPIDCIGVNGLTDIFGNKLDSQIKNARRIWPSIADTQGFFIAKLVRQ